MRSLYRIYCSSLVAEMSRASDQDFVLERKITESDEYINHLSLPTEEQVCAEELVRNANVQN